MISTDSIRILIIDDNPFMGPALERWFGRLSNFKFVGWIGSTQNAEDAIRGADPHVLLLDFHIPGEDVLEFLAGMGEKFPGISVAIYSGYIEPDNVRRCLDAGACGYLSKNDPPATLAAHIKMIVDGKMALSEDVEQALMLDGGYQPKA